MQEYMAYTEFRYIILYVLVAMCFLCYVWIRESMNRLTKGHIRNFFNYIRYVVIWGFVAAIWLFIVETEMIEVPPTYLVESFALLISILFVIISYASIKMREISEIFGFK